MSVEVPFGGPIKGWSEAGAPFDAFVSGKLVGDIPEESRTWACRQVLRALQKALQRPPSATAVAQNLAALSATVTEMVLPRLKAADLVGEVVMSFARVNETPSSQYASGSVTPSPRATPAPPRPVVPPTTAPSPDHTALATPALSNADALPFQPGTATPPPTTAVEALHENAGETAFVSALDIGEALPFESEVPELTVEQYASMCVERTMSPGQEGEIAERYKVLTEQALRALDQRFRRRFADEGELLQRYHQAYARYEAWLREQKK